MDYSIKDIERFFLIKGEAPYADLFYKAFDGKILVDLGNSGARRPDGKIYVYKNSDNTDIDFAYYKSYNENGNLRQLMVKLLTEILKRWLDIVENLYNNEDELCKYFNIDKLNIKLVEKQKKNIEQLYKKVCGGLTYLGTTSSIKNLIKWIAEEKGQNEDDRLADKYYNDNGNYIQFKNCKVDLRTGEKEERTDKDFITKIINHTYFSKKSKKNIDYHNKVKEVKELLFNICNSNQQDYEFITDYLGYCLTSEKNIQIFLNICGTTAGNGKSTLMNIFNECFDIYTFKANKEMFKQNNPKVHKTLNGTKNKRLVYIEEVDKSKMDVDLLKDTVSGGIIQNEVLFSYTENLTINFKLILITNHILNFSSDAGIKRRLIAIEFKNKFVSAEDYEKEKANHKLGNVFVCDDQLMDKFKYDADYKNIFINIIIEKAVKYYKNGKKIIIPDEYKKLGAELCDMNDKMKLFLDDCVSITGNDKDRIYKDDFLKEFTKHAGYNHYELKNLFSDARRHNINYEKDLFQLNNEGKKIAGKRGCFVGVKFIEHSNNSNDEPEFIDDSHNNPLDAGINDDKYKKLLDEIAKLKKEKEKDNKIILMINKEKSELKKENDTLKKRIKELESKIYEEDSSDSDDSIARPVKINKKESTEEDNEDAIEADEIITTIKKHNKPDDSDSESESETETEYTGLIQLCEKKHSKEVNKKYTEKKGTVKKMFDKINSKK